MALGNPLPVQSARRSTRSPEAEENPTRHKVVIGDMRRLIEKLPYVFKDPVRMQWQVDAKKLQFGSKLDDSAKVELSETKIAGKCSNSLKLLKK